MSKGIVLTVGPSRFVPGMASVPRSKGAGIAQFRIVLFSTGVILLLLACLSPCLATREPRKDAETGKVRILYVGDSLGLHTPARNFEMDPLVSITGIPATAAWYSTKDIRRFIRIYMPRSYEAIVDHHDVIILSDAGPQFFTPQHHAYFKETVITEGLGLIMIGGVETFGAEAGRMPWTGYPVESILPVELIIGSFNPRIGKVRIVDFDNRFIGSLPWDTLVPPHCYFDRFNNVILKQSANLLGVVEADGDHPWLVDWGMEKGWVFAMCSDWTPLGGSNFMRWEYYGDYVSNLVLYVAGLPVPHEHELKHAFVVGLKEYWLENNILVGMLDFVEKFGANTGPILRSLAQIDAGKKESERMYIDQNFQEAVPKLNEAIEKIRGLNNEALDLKDRTLLWMYIIEYFTVTGTSLISGVLLYWLMIKRRMYKEIAVTRGKSTRIA